jgi:uncharacterized protein (DUF362 family)
MPAQKRLQQCGAAWGFGSDISGGGYLIIWIKKAKRFTDRVKRKLFKPKIMRRLVSEGSARPRQRNTGPGREAGQPVIYRFSTTGSPDSIKNELESLIDIKYRNLVQGRKVLIKYNLNTANPYPAAVDPMMLRFLVDLLLNLGAREVSAGDCCTIRLLPTRKQVVKAGLPEALKGRAKLICFDDQPWVSVPVEGEYLESVTVPRAAIEAESIVSLANLKTHRQAAFTGALKLAVGFMHPFERIPLHRDHLQEKVAEINLALPSDFYIIDARTVMISGGPDFGKTTAADTLFIGDNPLALDHEGYKLLYSLKEKNSCLEGYSADPFSLVQFRHARALGIGGRPWQGYRVLNWPQSSS